MGAPALVGPLASARSWASGSGFTLPRARGRWWENHRHGKAPPVLAAPRPPEPPAPHSDGATLGDIGASSTSQGWGNPGRHRWGSGLTGALRSGPNPAPREHGAAEGGVDSNIFALEKADGEVGEPVLRIGPGNPNLRLSSQTSPEGCFPQRDL